MHINDPLFNWTADVEHINDDNDENDKLYKMIRCMLGPFNGNGSRGVAIGIMEIIMSWLVVWQLPIRRVQRSDSLILFVML